MTTSNNSQLTVTKVAELYHVKSVTVYRKIKAAKNKDGISKANIDGKEVTVITMNKAIELFGKEPPSTDVVTGSNISKEPAEQDVELLMELAELRATTKADETIKRQLEAERDRAITQADHWRQQAEKQTLLLTDERSRVEQAKEEATQKDKIISDLEAEKAKPKKSWWKVWG